MCCLYLRTASYSIYKLVEGSYRSSEATNQTFTASRSLRPTEFLQHKSPQILLKYSVLIIPFAAISLFKPLESWVVEYRAEGFFLFSNEAILDIQ